MSIKVFPFRLVLTQTPSEPAIVVSRRTCLATDDDMATPMYAKLYLIKRALGLFQGADKNLRPSQKRYKKDHDRRDRFAPIFLVADYIFLDRLSIFGSATERSSFAGYEKLLLRKEGPYKVICIDDAIL